MSLQWGQFLLCVYIYFVLCFYDFVKYVRFNDEIMLNKGAFHAMIFIIQLLAKLMKDCSNQWNSGNAYKLYSLQFHLFSISVSRLTEFSVFVCVIERSFYHILRKGLRMHEYPKTSSQSVLCCYFLMAPSLKVQCLGKW